MLIIHRYKNGAVIKLWASGVVEGEGGGEIINITFSLSIKIIRHIKNLLSEKRESSNKY